MHPEFVLGIKRATESKIRLYDPSITVPYDLKDHEGRIFHRKGAVVNPLSIRPLTKPLIFVNGEDKDQINWALQEKSRNESVKVILVADHPSSYQKNMDFAFTLTKGARSQKSSESKRCPQ